MRLRNIVTHHLFLWPQNALGRPVMIRMAPSTPKPGSILVSRTMGVAEAEADAEEGADAEVDAEALRVLVVWITEVKVVA